MDPRCYTLAQVRDRLQLPASTFKKLRAAGRLPFLQEIRPRLGKHPRYRADLVDRYLAGQWNEAHPEARRFLTAVRRRP